MAVGLSSANFADAILAALDTGTATLISSHVQAHNGDPGSAGTANVATGVSARKALTWAAPSGTDPRGRSITTTLPSWSATGTDTISHMSVWNALTVGTFRYSFTLTTPKAVTNGDTLNLTAHTISFTPIAA